MCNRTNKTATLNMQRNKYNCNTQFATGVKKLQNFSSRGRDNTATLDVESNKYNCNGLHVES